MKPSLATKLAHLSGRVEELNRLLSSESATADINSYRKLSQEHAEIMPIVELYQAYEQCEQEVKSVKEMLSDPEMKELAEAEIKDRQARMEELEGELQKHLLPKDANDDRNIFLEVRAGTGGDESALFAGNLFRMYTRYAERQRWQVEVISESLGEVGGYKEIIAKIIGQGVYSNFSLE
jgi:peptide chain release factor 1